MHTSTLARVANLRINLLLIILIAFSVSPAQSQVRTRVNLMIIDQNGSTLMDGNMTNYDNQYSNLVDAYDIWKMSNFGENFGIIRSAANLVIERRKTITSNDTSYFRMWNLQQRNYSLQVIVENMHLSNLYGFVYDNFTNQEIPVDLNDTTNISFTVSSQAATYAANRFKLVFTVPGFAVLPVTFTGIAAHRKNKDVMVKWEVESELLMDKYIVEASTDAWQYHEVNQVPSLNSSNKSGYAASDVQASAGDAFYRVKGISLGGKIQYSAVVKVAAEKATVLMNVYPNPVAGKIVHIQFGNLAAGFYELQLLDAIGNTVHKERLMSQGATTHTAIKLPLSTVPGMYRLSLTLLGQTVTTVPVMIQ